MAATAGIVVLVSLFAVGTAVFPFKRHFGEPVRAQELRGLGECKEMGEPCRGLPKCCGDTQCYWEDGYSMLTDGYCVTCVDQGLRCQRDTQCCEPKVCQKESPFHTDGFCDDPMPNGSACHEDDNCDSRHCEKSWYEVYGVCASGE